MAPPVGPVRARRSAPTTSCAFAYSGTRNPLPRNAFQQSARPVAASTERRIGPSGRQSEGPEQRGSDPLFRGGPRPSASRRCGGPWGSLPLCSGQDVAAWRAAIGSRRRRAIDHDRDAAGVAVHLVTAKGACTSS